MSAARLWLLGHGIAHSPSPAMQNAALRACGLDWEYAIRDVAPADLDGVLQAMRAGAAVGANVTIPHKRAVAAACDELEGDAAVTGAVNTVVVEDGRLIGANTDARGLELALRHDGLWPDMGAAVVVLGAGGAAGAAGLALYRSSPSGVWFAARRLDAATQVGLALSRQDYRERAAAVVAGVRPSTPHDHDNDCDFGALRWSADGVVRQLRAAPHAVLVNATPAPLADLPVDVAALPSTCTVVDLRYRPRPVDLVDAARARGLRATDGLEMLLQQGMLSFTRWTGREAPVDAARAALQQAVGA